MNAAVPFRGLPYAAFGRMIAVYGGGAISITYRAARLSCLNADYLAKCKRRGEESDLAMEPCPTCGHNNPSGNSYCGGCGAALSESALIVRRPAPIQIGERQLATPQLKALAATVAVSVAALLAEAGLAYLQRRLSQMERPSFSKAGRKARSAESSVIVPPKKRNGRVITIVGERVVEEKRWGRPVRRVVERFAWRGEESNS